jgi:hypothetical protein
MNAFEENILSKISRLSNIDLQLTAQRVSIVRPDRCRSPGQDCCVRSDLAAFTSADAFSGRSEGTIRVSGNMRANNSEMLREVAIAGRPYLDAQLARRALISRQVACEAAQCWHTVRLTACL